MWIVHVDPAGEVDPKKRCQHVNFVQHTLVSRAVLLIRALHCSTAKMQSTVAIGWHYSPHPHYTMWLQVPGEEEYLFTAYSVFTVMNDPIWGANSTDRHEIHLQAALDNKLEPEDLPLAPWY